MEPKVKVWKWKRGKMYFRWIHKPHPVADEFESADPTEEEYFLRFEDRHTPYLVTTTIAPGYVFAKAGEIEGKHVVISGNAMIGNKITYASAEIPYEMWNIAAKIIRYFDTTVQIGIWRKFLEAHFVGPTYVTFTTSEKPTVIMIVRGEGGITNGDMDR